MKRKYEDCPADKAADRKGAAKAGMSVAKWEKSPMDKRKDAAGQKAMDAKGRGRK